MTSSMLVPMRGALFLLAVLLIPLSSAAQELPGWNPDFSNPSLERRLSVGLEVGKPLIFGPTAAYNFSSHMQMQFGFASLGDFTALSGEVRLNLLEFGVEVPVPFLAAGFTQYYLADGAVETSPTAVHGALGIEWMFLSYVGTGVRLGYAEALGGSRDPDVDRYGVSDNMGTIYFTVSARYMF